MVLDNYLNYRTFYFVGGIHYQQYTAILKRNMFLDIDVVFVPNIPVVVNIIFLINKILLMETGRKFSRRVKTRHFNCLRGLVVDYE